VVAILTNQSKLLKFTLTYNIEVKTITARTSGDDYVLANFDEYLTDFIVKDLVNHNQEAPVTLRTKKESPFYSLDRAVEWRGLTGKNFFGGKTAEATITIPAKPGYTFEGTDITISDLIGDATTPKVFNESSPAGEITKAGDELVFTLAYYVKKSPISIDLIDANITEKLPVPVIGVGPVTNLRVNKNAPFTGGSGAITWAGLSTTNKFISTSVPRATVTLLAKDGYEFEDTIKDIPLTSNWAFDEGEISVVGSQRVAFNLGNKLVVTVNYGSVNTTVDTIYVGAFTGSSWPGSLVHESSSLTSVTSAGSLQIKPITTAPNDGNSKFEWVLGKNASSQPDYKIAFGKLHAKALLTPGTGYTFAGLQLNDTIKSRIKDVFKIGTITPEIIPVIKGNNLEIDLVYSIERNTTSGISGPNIFVKGSMTTLVPTTNISSWTSANYVGTITSLSNVDVGTPSINWSAGTGSTTVVGDVLTIVATITPEDGYKFPPVVVSSLETALADANKVLGGVLDVTVVATADQIRATLKYTVINEIAAAALTAGSSGVLGSSNKTNFAVGQNITGIVWTSGGTSLPGVTVTPSAVNTSGVADISSLATSDEIVITLVLTAGNGYRFIDNTDTTSKTAIGNAAKTGLTGGATTDVTVTVSADRKTLTIVLTITV
jgi:hypothetical protein